MERRPLVGRGGLAPLRTCGAAVWVRRIEAA